jgi:hypothetical protein
VLRTAPQRGVRTLKVFERSPDWARDTVVPAYSTRPVRGLFLLWVKEHGTGCGHAGSGHKPIEVRRSPGRDVATPTRRALRVFSVVCAGSKPGRTYAMCWTQ